MVFIIFDICNFYDKFMYINLRLKYNMATGILPYILNTVEFINRYVIIPLTLVTFALLVYFAFYLGKSDPDVIKSKIFLRFEEFRKAFIVLAIAAFTLVFHVIFIYLPKFSEFVTLTDPQYAFLKSFQQLLGLVLAILLLLFAYAMFKAVK